MGDASNNGVGADAGAIAEPPTRGDAGRTGATVRLGPAFLARLGLGGFLMGAANLVPGISGGTMLVAAGVYHTFIDAVGDAARLKLGGRTLTVLGVVGMGFILAFATLTGAVVWGLTEFRWGMYSLFIGLTLGGVPVMLAMIRDAARGRTGTVWVAGGLGAAAMAALALAQGGATAAGAGPGGGLGATALYTVGGVAGAASMILPGLSGAFVLLILGLYEPVVGSIKAFIEAGTSLDLAAAAGELSILIPVGVGVLVGIGGIGSLLKWLLKRHERATLGFLTGLLVAAPLGLYPFRAGVEPRLGDVMTGTVLETEEQLAEALEDPKQWRQEFYTPRAGQVLASLALAAVGVGATVGIGLIGRADRAHAAEDALGLGDGAPERAGSGRGGAAG